MVLRILVLLKEPIAKQQWPALRRSASVARGDDLLCNVDLMLEARRVEEPIGDTLSRDWRVGQHLRRGVAHCFAVHGNVTLRRGRLGLNALVSSRYKVCVLCIVQM